jgi:hypothetical protein
LKRAGDPFYPVRPAPQIGENEVKGEFKVMTTEQYHEPPEELSHEVRTFARIVASLQEEAEAIGWYEQRISLERDSQAKALMEDAQQEEFKHFAMALEFLSRRKPKWQAVLKEVLFKRGDIVKHGEAGEKAEERVD